MIMIVLEFFFDQVDGFPYQISRGLGDFSNSGFSKIKSILKNKYELIASPDMEEIEKFATINSQSNLNFYYENKKDKEKPRYIELSASRSITISYYSEEYFENKILKQLKKRKNKYKDL